MVSSGPMGRIIRALRPEAFPVHPGGRWGARHLLRLAGVCLAGAGLAASAAWLARAALGADRSPWPARLVDAITEMLRAAWTP